ncbi:MAG: NUDIX domain-containing protein [Anaerolineae bacterium]|nr:NUDIX domain-containing protein [Anaerolineae bacterium]
MSPDKVPIIYQAAGGVVTDVAGERVLLLIRPARDEVRLPKGHVEPGESTSEAAVRETQEETGYGNLAIVASLGKQLVAFQLGRHSVHRTEFYFLLKTLNYEQIARPEADDEQFFPIWVTWEEALEHLTFAAEQEWVRRAIAYRKKHPSFAKESP